MFWFNWFYNLGVFFVSLMFSILVWAFIIYVRYKYTVYKAERDLRDTKNDIMAKRIL